MPIDVKVPADIAWTDTEVRVEEGKQIRITYVSGTWTCNPQASSEQYDANGIDGLAAKSGYAVPGANEGGLVGKVGERAFWVGRDSLVPTMGPGDLLLGINDDQQGKYGRSYADNQGALIVRIVVSDVVPVASVPRQVVLPNKVVETDEYQLDELIAMQSELDTKSAAYQALGEEIQTIREHRADAVAAFPVLGRTGFYRTIAPRLVGNPIKRAKYCERRYGKDHGTAVLETIGQLASLHGDAFFELMVDPGLMSPSHLASFEEFVAERAEEVAGPWALRDAYAHSGTARKGYRALYLNEADSKQIESTGNFAGAVRSLRGPDKEAFRARVVQGELDLGEMFDIPIRDVMSSRITGRSMQKYFDFDEIPETSQPKKETAEGSLSVSSSQQICAAVAAAEFGGADPEPGKDVYLFETELSPVDVLNPEDYGLGLSQKVRTGDTVETVKGGALESFVLGGLLPNSEPTTMTKVQAPYPRLVR